MRKIIEMMTMMTTIGPMIMTMIMPETKTTMKNMRMRKMIIMMTTMITRGRPDDMSVWWERREAILREISPETMPRLCLLQTSGDIITDTRCQFKYLCNCLCLCIVGQFYVKSLPFANKRRYSVPISISL